MESGSEDAVTMKGDAPGGVGLLLIDVINPMDFEGAESLGPKALQAGEAIARLRNEADRLGVPVIYVNDNYGYWSSEREKLVEMTAKASEAARRLVERLRPRTDDFFIIKPQFSGFYATNLPVLLPRLGVSRVVLTGFAADICVLFTAADAHMREYDIWAPRDAVASDQDAHAEWALGIMEKSMGAETAATTTLTLAAWVNRHADPPNA